MSGYEAYDEAQPLPAAEKDEDGSDSPAQQKRVHLPDDGEEGKVCVRFLLPNTAAGSVIGKGGSTITEFQTQSSARIQLSRNREFFPGTAERILLLSGTINAILTALHLLISKIQADEESSGNGTAGQTVIKVVVPNSTAGAIIGKGGATIRSYCEDSGATIKMSSQDQQVPGISDRVATVSGSVDQVLRAVALITTRMSEEAGYPTNIARPYTYSNLGGGLSLAPALYAPASPMSLVAPRSPLNLGGGLLTGIANSLTQLGVGGVQPTTVTVAVPNEHIGAVIGRSGQTITEMQHLTGAQIKVSGREDVVPGTNNRKVTLTGSPDAVQIAQFMISKKVQESAAEMGARGSA